MENSIIHCSINETQTYRAYPQKSRKGNSAAADKEPNLPVKLMGV